MSANSERSAADLNETQQQDARRRMAPGVGIVFEAVRREGEEELSRNLSGLAWSGLAAGLSMGFSFLGESLLQAFLPHAPWQRIVSSLGYSVGFLIVILGRQQLFTENTLTPIIQLLHQRRLSTLMRTAQLWAVVLAANILGALIFAAVIAHTAIFDPHVHAVLNQISHRAVNGDFSTMLLRGVFAGWLIALMLWLLPFAETGRLWVIIIITYFIGLADFAHIIAGSVEAFYAVVTGQASVGAYVLHFFTPVLIGNVIGGVSLVAALNYAQVATSGISPD